MREALYLARPSSAHREAVAAFRQEFFDRGETVIHGGALLDTLEYDAWLSHLAQTAAQGDWVPFDTLLALRPSDGRLIGIVDIRHNLNNVFLATYGGHIGYAVRPTERRKGYATEILRLALAHAAELGLYKVMLSCFADNEGSRKTILQCGGRLSHTCALEGRPVEVYLLPTGLAKKANK